MIKNIKLLKKEFIANNTMAFYFEKPTNFEFTAGQYCDITLINPSITDKEENIRTLSFAAAPFEKKLLVATRMRDTAFKNVLKDLSIGSNVKLDGPYGDFTLHNNEKIPAVFLIGGIGITAVRSIIAQSIFDQLAYKITLLYSNRTPSDAAFVYDFENFEKANQNFTFIPIYTKNTDSKWNGEHRHIDIKMINKYVPDLLSPIYYMSGPPKMVRSMRQMLINAGIDSANIRTEEFSGY
jgi:ferredoxin-NADP reductase